MWLLCLIADFVSLNYLDSWTSPIGVGLRSPVEQTSIVFNRRPLRRAPFLIAAISLSRWHNSLGLLSPVLSQRATDVHLFIKTSLLITSNETLVRPCID